MIKRKLTFNIFNFIAEENDLLYDFVLSDDIKLIAQEVNTENNIILRISITNKSLIMFIILIGLRLKIDIRLKMIILQKVYLKL